MARTAITANLLVANSKLTLPTPDSIDAANGMYLAAGYEADKVIFLVKNTTASAKAATVVAGDNPPALRAGLGNLTGSSLAQNASEFLGPFDASRFLQNDGTIQVDFGSSMTGEITALIIPRNV